LNIICAGIARSGSTRLYNIVRLGLEQNFPAEQISAQWVNSFVPGEHHNILKIHDFKKRWLNWSDFVFTTRRDIRYIAASALDLMPRGTYKNTDSIIQMCKEILDMYEAWNDHTDYELVYEDFKENKEKVVQTIFGILGLPVDCNKLLDDLSRIGNPAGEFDKTTLMHVKHISENTFKHYTKRLSKEHCDAINTTYKYWLDSKGYKIAKTLYI